MASKGPIIALGAITGVLFFWRRKRKRKATEIAEPGAEGEVAAEEVVVTADD
jgi:hypothetical protein